MCVGGSPGGGLPHLDLVTQGKESVEPQTAPLQMSFWWTFPSPLIWVHTIILYRKEPKLGQGLPL